MRRTGVWLLAWSAVGIVWAQGEAMPDTPAPVAGDTPAGPGLRWQLPPVVWSGSIAYDLRLDQTGRDPHSTTQYVTATLNGLTYVYQPWLALLSGTLSVAGIQGHVAYPERARNPIHQAMAPLAELAARQWDDGYTDFPASSFQISNISAGTGANNVIPGRLEAKFNFRYNPSWRAEQLEREVHEILDRHGLNYEITWQRGGEPFLTHEGPLRKAVRAVIAEHCGLTPVENTGGGTSDARFIAPLGAEVIEFGPINASIHKIDEHVSVADLERLPMLYAAMARKLLL